VGRVVVEHDSCTMSAWHPPINRPSPPDAVVTLAEVMQGIRAPHPDTVTTVAHIRSAIANNDKPAADEAKGARLHYITPAATFGKRRAISEVVALSGP